ncbi:LuxR C-terminal-related transcriptional regulator [Croceitalea marina]|uniref:LuxR C-terminal-related transcriptional regulator n=1 Tax=Croceitalea marina TaxID=1775166 RepID=A0ABW5MRM5_9FLAO
MKFERILLKYKKYFLVLAIVLTSVAISIRSHDGKVDLILRDYPIIIFLMMIISIFLFVLYAEVNKRSIGNLSLQIKERSKDKGEDFNQLLFELTGRQKEVYDLIIAGKTNKEIMSELFIEQSTLKTHINQIYRKLDIKNRKELKSKLNHQ